MSKESTQKINDVDLLEHVKEYLRIDGDHDDDIVGLLIDSAKEYMKNAGVEEQVNPLYKLAITMLVTHWYENRLQTPEGRTSDVLKLGLQSIILQLKVGDGRAE